MEAQGDLPLGLSIMVQSTQSSGMGGQITGNVLHFSIFNFSFLRISLFRASDRCVNNTPSTIAQLSHIFSRVLGLKDQHWCSQPLRAQHKLILIRATLTSGGVASCRSAFPFSLTHDVHLPPVPHVPLPCEHSSLLPSLCDSFDEVLRHAWFHTSPSRYKSSASCRSLWLYSCCSYRSSWLWCRCSSSCYCKSSLCFSFLSSGSNYHVGPLIPSIYQIILLSWTWLFWPATRCLPSPSLFTAPLGLLPSLLHHCCLPPFPMYAATVCCTRPGPFPCSIPLFLHPSFDAFPPDCPLFFLLPLPELFALMRWKNRRIGSFFATNLKSQEFLQLFTQRVCHTWNLLELKQKSLDFSDQPGRQCLVTEHPIACILPRECSPVFDTCWTHWPAAHVLKTFLFGLHLTSQRSWSLWFLLLFHHRALLVGLLALEVSSSANSVIRMQCASVPNTTTHHIT